MIRILLQRHSPTPILKCKQLCKILLCQPAAFTDNLKNYYGVHFYNYIKPTVLGANNYQPLIHKRALLRCSSPSEPPTSRQSTMISQTVEPAEVNQWFEVLDRLVGPYWKETGIAFNYTFLLFTYTRNKSPDYNFYTAWYL